MEKCEICGVDKIQIPAGTSKATGKPYNAFWGCPNRCKKPSQSDTKHEEIMEGLREIWSKVDNIEKGLKK